MRKTIKLITLVITMLLLSTISFADSSLDAQINNNQVNFNRQHNGQPVGKPFIENNRTYLPIRVISEDLGYNVDWKEATKTAIITKGKTKVEITIGQSQALVNGVRKNIDNQVGVNTKAKMVGGRTYVPVRFISEAMGDKVEYRNPSTSNVTKPTVYINCTNLPVETPEKPVTPPTTGKISGTADYSNANTLVESLKKVHAFYGKDEFGGGFWDEVTGGSIGGMSFFNPVGFSSDNVFFTVRSASDEDFAVEIAINSWYTSKFDAPMYSKTVGAYKKINPAMKETLKFYLPNGGEKLYKIIDDAYNDRMSKETWKQYANKDIGKSIGENRKVELVDIKGESRLYIRVGR